MTETTENKVSLEEKYNDYEKSPVPEKARQTWFEQGMVWLGAGFGLSGLATGGVLADGLSFRDMIIVSIIGSIIITIIGTLNALVSEHTHMSTSFTCRRSFGVQGAKIIGIILCISNFGWYAFQADLFGNTVSSIIKEVGGMSITPVIFTVIGGLAMSLTAIFGFKAIKKLSELGLPLLFVLCIIAVWKTGQQVAFSDIISAGPVGPPSPSLWVSLLLAPLPSALLWSVTSAVFPRAAGIVRSVSESATFGATFPSWFAVPSSTMHSTTGTLSRS